MSISPLILIDGSSYLYRAFHALPPLTNSKGQATGAIYGVINMLRKLISDYPSSPVAVIFDPKGKTFRDDLFAEYKSHRPPMPDDLRDQVQPLFAVIKAMGLPLIVIDHYEADDVIGTLAMLAKQQKMPTLISTGDKDMAQLVDADITLINTMTNKIMTSDAVVEKFGVPPHLIIDYLALVGDSVDNVPGIPGCGPKTAVKWLQEFGSLENIITRAAEVKGKVGDNLRAHLAQLPLMRQLVTIKLDVPLNFTLDDLRQNEPQQEELIALYKQLEFKTWLAELLATPHVVSKKQEQHQYKTIYTEAEFEELLTQLNQAEYFAFDTETTSLNYMQAQIVGISFAIKPQHAVYIPLAHDYENAPQQLSRDTVLKKLKTLLEDSRPKIIGQHIKYDMNVLVNHGIYLRGIAFDTMMESYVFNSTSNRHDMDTLSLKYLGHRTITFEEVAGKGAKQLSFNQVPIEQAANYAAEDADVTLQLHHHLWQQLQSQPTLRDTFETIEMPLIPVLSRMERHGVLLDINLLTQQSAELTKRIADLEEKAYQLAGSVFNLASPKQLQEIFFNQLKLPVLEKTPSGQASTAESVLEELALDYPLPKIILEYRQLSKLKSTYIDRLPEQVDSQTKRVHTSYHQAIAATGRLSSSDPNLQNIPIRTAEGRAIRKAFIAPPGYKIIAADYSQIELRIMAHLSQDKSLLRAFAEKLDVHKATAAEIFNTPLDKVNADQRRSAKAINFGLIYGMSAFGLAKQLGIDRHAAQNYMNIYFTRYPGVKNYMDSTRALAHEKGYVETIFGRRLYLPEINSKNFQLKSGAERAAINAPMQGTAADIIKRAMIDVDTWLQNSKFDARMLMQVHDELVFEVADAWVESVQQEVRQRMCAAAQLLVPIEVDVGVGLNWDEAH